MQGLTNSSSGYGYSTKAKTPGATASKKATSTAFKVKAPKTAPKFSITKSTIIKAPKLSTKRLTTKTSSKISKTPSVKIKKAKVA